MKKWKSAKPFALPKATSTAGLKWWCRVKKSRFLLPNSYFPILTFMHPLVYYYPTGHEEHSQEGHPERPERVEAIAAALENAGWWEPYPKLHPLDLPMEVFRAIHTRPHLAQLEWVSMRGGASTPTLT